MKMLKREVFFVYVLLIFLTAVKCAEILAIFNLPLKSLHLGGVALAEVLAEKNHNVTLVSSQPISPPPNNFEHLFLSEIAKSNEASNKNYFDLNVNSHFQAYLCERIGIETAAATFQDLKFKQLLRSRKFDLIILEFLYADSLVYIAEYLKVPLILYSSLDASYVTNFAIGNFAPPSYIPNILTEYTEDMTFLQRLDNLLISVSTYVVRNAVGISAHDEITKKNFPGAPNIIEYYNKASVILLNSDTSIFQPEPLLPGMIDVGGFHIRPPKKLPMDLEGILSNSKHGVIYFSLGSVLKSSQMPKKSMKHLLTVFSKLKQTVLWKWEAEELPEKPSNVVIHKWLPQNDILAHKNVKLFITHGGMHSLLETVYHGVPCVILPVFFDQRRNAKRAEHCGFAERIQFEDLTEERLEWAIKEVLSNPRYVKSAKERSSILRDKPLSQADTVAFWVDYVIRHQGADHLRVESLKLTWYQYFLLDVLLFLIVCLILSIFLIKYSMKVLWCKRITNKLKMT